MNNAYGPKAYARTEKFRIAVADMATIAAIISLLSILCGLGYRSFLDLVSFSFISGCAAAILLAVFMRSVYGIKKSRLLLSLSLIFMSILQLITCFETAWAFGYSYHLIVWVLWILNLISLVSYAVLAVSFIKAPGKDAIRRIFAAAAAAATLVNFLLWGIIIGRFYFEAIMIAVMIIVMIVPVSSLLFPAAILLFVFNCPLDHKRIKTEPKGSAQEQAVVLDDIGSQLSYLKSLYESGKINDQEYELKRRQLVDRV